jgi:hypothetical protein
VPPDNFPPPVAQGFTPIHAAACKNFTSVVKRLAEKGANLQIKYTVRSQAHCHLI